MKLAPLRADLQLYLKEHQLVTKWHKAKELFEANVRHPSLNFELLEPHWYGIYSFRIDRKYRAHLSLIVPVAQKSFSSRIIIKNDRRPRVYDYGI